MLAEQLAKARKTESQRWAGHSFKLIAVGFFLLAVLLVATFLWRPPVNVKQERSDLIQENISEANLSEDLRADFKNALKVFESEVEPLIDSASFALWNNERKNNILSNKANAISLFSSGDYKEALGTLKKASDLSMSELERMGSAFDSALITAEKHYGNDEYDLSKVAITKAVGIRPDNQNALTLARKIDALPQVLKLLDAAKVAQIENNLEKEISNLRKVQKLAPNRAEVQGRLSTLEIQFKEFKFSSHIKNGLNQVLNRKIKAASASLADAQSIFPSRYELIILREQVQNLSKTLKVEELLEKAGDAVKRENWKMALDLYVELNKIEPTNKISIDKIAVAKKILSVSAQAISYVENAQRLSSSNVMASAKNLLNESTKYLELSKDLKLRVSKLNRLVHAYSQKVSLMIESDGLTEIFVRGVGRVGKVKEKNIKLRPGIYTFEGVRPGYKSRLIRFEIPPRSTNMTIRIICNEQL